MEMDFRKVSKLTKHDNPNDFRKMDNILAVLSTRHKDTGDSLVHVVCREGREQLLKYFLEEIKVDRPTDVENKDGKRPLHDAAQFSQEKCARRLLESKASVDPLKRGDWTPLMLACTKDSSGIVELLLDAGANPAIRNKDGWNSFHIACREGHMDVLHLLIQRSSDIWRTRSNNLRSPLHTAALHGHTAAVEFLLTHCHFPSDIVDTCEVTPLMDSLRAGFVDTAKVLVHTHKEDPTKEDKTGRQAIHMVAQAGESEALVFLVNEMGVNPNVAASKTSETPLHVAAKEGQSQILKQLLDFDVDINAADKRGRTALHIASGCQKSECVRVLLERGAQQFADLDGKTPQQHAIQPEVVRVFADWGKT